MPMNRIEMLRNLRFLSDVLEQRGIQGEIVLYGGAAMMLAFDARQATRDVDAVFKPEQLVQEAAHDVSIQYGAPLGWLNDAVAAFVSDREDLRFLMEFSHLRIYHAAPEYLLAMKCMSMRVGRGDKDLFDIKFLAGRLGLTSAQEVLAIVERYYPGDRISERTKLIVEELFAQRDGP